MVIAANITGHQKRFEAFRAANRPPEESDILYIGGGDVLVTGWRERELISRHKPLAGAAIIDLGCGIGRLTRYLAEEPIGSYLGTDIIPDILARARGASQGKSNFRFEIVDSCRIPQEDASADTVCAFSLITHLLDEEVFDYFKEASRVLKPGGVIAFSFIDFVRHKSMFLRFAQDHASRHDVLKFFEKSTLEMFGKECGFDLIEFLDAGVKTPARAGQLLDGRDAPTDIDIGQSMIFMRRR